MDITAEHNEQTLTLNLSGRLDVTTAPLLEQALSAASAEHLILDLRGCDYVSSAGLREILRAHKLQAQHKGSLTLTNVSGDIKAILDTTGFSKFITVKPKIREISIDGLEFLSAGVCGECYRLDAETIVKLYHEGIEPAIAEKEKEYARAAFVLGIPTAISYDVVACGSRTGVVYEMLEAELFSSVIRKNLHNLDQHAQTLAQVAKAVHATPADPKIFPDIKTNFRQYIAQMDFFLSAEQINFLQRKLDSIPEADTCVHFDLHTSNIMIKDGDPIIIDMGDVSRGSYLFDVGLLYTIYGFPALNICEMVTKIPDAAGAQLWERFLVHYFADKPQREYDFFNQNRHFFASLRLIYTITFLPKMRDQLAITIRDVLLPQMMA